MDANYSAIYFPKFLRKGAKWMSIENDKNWADNMSYYLQLYPIFQKPALKIRDRLVQVFKSKYNKKRMQISPHSA